MTRNEFIATTAARCVATGYYAGILRAIDIAIRLADELERQGVAPWKN